MAGRRDRLTVADITGLWAIMPTPANPDASDWRATNTVNVDEAVRVVNELIDAGVDGILSLGTLGECGTLTREDKRTFMGAIYEAGRGRVPIFGGTSSLSTRETVEQTIEARDIGLEGTMLGPPMWNKPDIGWAVQFHRDVAEAVPEMAQIAYANPFVFKFDFPPPYWAQMATIPQVVGAKTATAATFLRDTGASQYKIRMMPMESEYYAGARLDPENCTALWSSSVCCGPAPGIAIRDLVNEAKQTGDWKKAKALNDEIVKAIMPVIAYGDMNQFQMHNVALEKGRMNASGWMNAGPNRPPHHVIPDHIKKFAEEAGTAWNALHQRLSQG